MSDRIEIWNPNFAVRVQEAEHMSHTPGPWSATIGSFPTVNGPDGGGIAQMCKGAVPEVSANANLIAAAPELLAACRDVLELFPEGDLDYRAPRLCRRLKRAIAKAEGREP